MKAPPAALSRLLHSLEAYRRALHEADADPEMLVVFGKVLSHLRRLRPNEVAALLGSTRSRTRDGLTEAEAQELREMPLSRVEEIVTDDKTSRRVLEEIAAVRFEVPRGSMRKWSASSDLREKILTMIRNERVHQTIAQVARRSGES